MSELNPLGKWLKLVHSCDCGSQEPYERWYADAEGNKLFKICKKCKERKIREYEADLNNQGKPGENAPESSPS